MCAEKNREAETILLQLIHLSQELGREDRQLAILGEGNVSADIGDGTFWVKASGSQLGNIDESGFSRVRFEAISQTLKADHLDDEQVYLGLQRSLADGAYAQPSVETFLHALCLTEGAARWVGHTHSVAVNQILCSQHGAEPFLKHLFPEEVVVCGKVPAVVAYVDPGFPLALALRDELHRYQDEHGRPPKLLLLINHGPVALGQTAQEVLNIMLMADKWARILQGTYALDGPQFLSQIETERIDNRLDEHYRRRRLRDRQ